MSRQYKVQSAGTDDRALYAGMVFQTFEEAAPVWDWQETMVPGARIIRLPRREVKSAPGSFGVFLTLK